MSTITFSYRSPMPYKALSNMYSDKKKLDGGFFFEHNGTRYFANTVEHYYQANKTTDEEGFQRILLAKDGFSARRLGRTVPLRPDWNNEFKLTIMLYALYKKFQNEKMASILLSTGNDILVENGWWDGFWGCGAKGKGQNMMGKALMTIRMKLQETR